MELNQILILLAVIVVGYLVLKFIWNSAKGIVKLAIALIIIVGGIYLVKPELLYNVFGKDKVESVANEIKEESGELVEDGKELLEEGYESAKDSIEKKVDETVTQ